MGPRRMMIAGMGLASLNTLLFLLVDLETAQWWIRGLMFMRGWSFALILVPLQAATFATIRLQDTGRASAVFNAGRQVAASFGVALLATVLTNRMTAHDAVLGNPATREGALLAFHDAFIVAALLALLGMTAALLVSDRAAAASMRRPVAGEQEEAAAAAPR